MDMATTKAGEFDFLMSIEDAFDQSGGSGSSQAEQLHWLLSATGIWEELRYLEEEQLKLQDTLQNVLRRRHSDYYSPEREVKRRISPRFAMLLAGSLTILVFVVVNTVLMSSGSSWVVWLLAGYLGMIVAVLVDALFSSL